MTDDILLSLRNVFPLRAGCSHPELFSWVENLELERTSERGITPEVHRLSPITEHGRFLWGGKQLHILSTNSP